jgi:mono/diheme cytochrome c family protein
MMQAIRRVVITIVILGVTGAVGIGAFVYSGIYNIGADDHHTRPVFSLLQTLRERSIAVRARHVQVPDLEDPALILKGAGQYAAMCTQCHLTPGMKDSEIRPGLYPQPPNLARLRVAPGEAFWVIKHGIKMSAMPAWGGSHDDATIWSMVAFLQKLPDLSPKQYKDMVAKAPPDDDMDMSEMDRDGKAADRPAEQRAGSAVDQGGDAGDLPAMAMPAAPTSVAPPPAVKASHRRH